IEDAMQTTAAVNPGNSGGALADANGNVVGINTAVAGIGLGLAVPMNATTRRIVATLLSDGRVRRAYLGVVGVPAPVPAQVAERAGQREGLRLVEVVIGSPAAKAGLGTGDGVPPAAGRRTPAARATKRRLSGGAIAPPLPIPALRTGAMVDVIAIPAELVDA